MKSYTATAIKYKLMIDKYDFNEEDYRILCDKRIHTSYKFEEAKEGNLYHAASALETILEELNEQIDRMEIIYPEWSNRYTFNKPIDDM